MEMSRLSLGCMRFVRNGAKIDQNAAINLVQEAIKGGITLFDTAYIYEGSEAALGHALQALDAREQVMVSTKMPIFLCKKPEDFERYFTKQLERLRTRYVDYYFIHAIGNIATWERLRALGIEEWLEKKRQNGQIHRVGFSFHGGKADFITLLNARAWDFCMIQYNYLDEYSQAGRTGLQAAYEKGVPVFVMEPLRGGSLVRDLPAEACRAFAEVNPERSLADWGLRWVLNQKEVTTVLSGMNSVEMLRENLKTLADTPVESLTDDEKQAYAKVIGILNRKLRVPCTGCRYCLPCPQNVDIPTCFTYYNNSYTQSYKQAFLSYIQSTGAMSGAMSDASRCTGCKRCEKHCPQGISIAAELKKVKRRMMSPVVMPVAKGVRKIMRIDVK